MANSKDTIGDVARARTMRVTFADGTVRSYTLECNFGGDVDDVLSLALRSIVIDEQRAIRAGGISNAPDDNAKLDRHVSAYGRGQRARDPMARADAALNKLTAEQIAQLIARRQ